ncbi:lipoate--protein ligase [Clostridium sp. YIM B02515]|uniref:lipoate--protein ligase n=1 Tax=Clostridium rhizosphaerae TaxID=2803861 RepID=A0ABS1TGW1_9CLOT|nr:lipoate--protein ligase [Clostridium rhizosphaerae]MBL4937564.1 lipoate--protein ligase [Clostridium rhizosphaerae]
MLFIDNNLTNPYFNLATEEYLLKNFNEDVFMLWRNEPSIIVGKNQNTLSEINYEYVKEKSIPVVRRLTGGGAVFHDLGNINFTFISTDDSKSFTNFRKFTQPIIDVLKELNINAEFTGRNDLTIEGKKFSGNAQCNYKNKVMHHGTLLFTSVINDISSALKVKPTKFEGKGIKSVASRVTNISDHLKTPITILEFKDMIMKHVSKMNDNYSVYELSEEDLGNIKKLYDEKYNTWQWNYGSSPKYSLVNEVKFSGGNLEFYLNVEKGKITEIKIFGDFFGKANVSDIESLLIGEEHNEEVIEAALSNINIDDYIAGAIVEDIVKGLM